MKFTTMAFDAVDQSISFSKFGWNRVLEIKGDDASSNNKPVISAKRDHSKNTQT